MKNIVLLGYMGCGKSAVGRKLAQKKGLNYLDLDAYIESKESVSIAAIFKQKGEVYFRKIESFYLKECLEHSTKTVISLGGGTPCFGENMELITTDEKAISIYLRTSIPTLTDRLFPEKDKRPVIAHLQNTTDLQEFIAKHLFERLAFYARATHTLDTDKKSIEEIVDEIIRVQF